MIFNEVEQALRNTTAAIFIETPSNLSYPAKISHATVPRAKRERPGITDDLIRVSVGLEDIGDLIEDLEKRYTDS